MFLYTQRSKWKAVDEKTLHRRVERCIKMKFFRFTNHDSNYSVEQNVHTWELPLSLEHRKVGVSSFNINLTNEYLDDNAKNFIVVFCNLLDRTMENQNGVLEIIPVQGESYVTFARGHNQIGFY